MTIRCSSMPSAATSTATRPHACFALPAFISAAQPVLALSPSLERPAGAVRTIACRSRRLALRDRLATSGSPAPLEQELPLTEKRTSRPRRRDQPNASASLPVRVGLRSLVQVLSRDPGPSPHPAGQPAGGSAARAEHQGFQRRSPGLDAGWVGQKPTRRLGCCGQTRARAGPSLIATDGTSTANREVLLGEMLRMVAGSVPA
jgi:hypothetical protein